jgi:hypothetical protein
VALRIIGGATGFGWNALSAMQGLIISRQQSIIWIIPEIIEMAILCFIGGYVIAYIYNRFT